MTGEPDLSLDGLRLALPERDEVDAADDLVLELGPVDEILAALRPACSMSRSSRAACFSRRRVSARASELDAPPSGVGQVARLAGP